jgi:hypothetical protein
MEEIEAILEENDNKICVDCFKPEIQWVSINHGVFICKDCAVVHRALGSSISFIKQLDSDFSDK